jgi:hypothetical protein
MRGFRDLFIAIGLAIFAVGLTTSVLSLTDSYEYTTRRLDGEIPFAPVGFLILLCVIVFVLSERITRRYRLPLSSIVVATSFAFSLALLVRYIVVPFYPPFDLGPMHGLILSPDGNWGAFAGAALGASIFYWRYRLPFSLFLVAGSVVGLSLFFLRFSAVEAWQDDHIRVIVGLLGIATFGAAMWYDVRDRFRVTRASECAFWLHLAAAPMLVHALLYDTDFGAANLAFVFGTIVMLSIIALLIDRRALLVSGLSYLAGAIWHMVPKDTFIGDEKFAVTALLLGSFILVLGLGWSRLRRRIVAGFPFASIKARLPPAEAR